MKLLLLGIDGGDYGLIDGMDMPFLKSLITKSRKRQLTEDLISRGWGEILTGAHGSETRGLYMRPALDGTYQFTTKFGVGDILNNADICPLWQLAANAGHQVGFMNVPTTGPAPEVEGFLVAGGGGGVDKVSGLSPKLMHPNSIKSLLESKEYEVDLRLTTSGVTSFDELVDVLNRMVIKRTDSYLALAKQFSVQFGFPCFRVSTTLQYLAMSEIQAMLCARDMPELASPNQKHAPFSKIQERLLEHFRILDDSIKRIFEGLSPQHYIVTSDHGAVPYLHHANADAWLRSNGYQLNPQGASGTLRTTIKSIIKSILPKSTINKIAVASPQSLKKLQGARFDTRKSKAFSNYYMQGVFINDSERFQGPVSPGPTFNQLVDQLCEEINADPISIEHGIVAKPYRMGFPNAKFQTFLPDIHLTKPDTMFFTSQGDYVSRNERYGPLEDDLTNATDMHSGQKGRHPLFFFDPSMEDYDDKSKSDLTAVYEMVRRALS